MRDSRNTLPITWDTTVHRAYFYSLYSLTPSTDECSPSIPRESPEEATYDPGVMISTEAFAAAGGSPGSTGYGDHVYGNYMDLTCVK